MLVSDPHELKCIVGDPTLAHQHGKRSAEHEHPGFLWELPPSSHDAVEHLLRPVVTFVIVMDRIGDEKVDTVGLLVHGHLQTVCSIDMFESNSCVETFNICSAHTTPGTANICMH